MSTATPMAGPAHPQILAATDSRGVNGLLARPIGLPFLALAALDGIAPVPAVGADQLRFIEPNTGAVQFHWRLTVLVFLRVWIVVHGPLDSTAALAATGRGVGWQGEAGRQRLSRDAVMLERERVHH